MTTSTSSLLTGLMTLAIMAAAGCGERVPKRPAVYRVQGKVMFKGAPVEGAQVNFKSDSSPRIAMGLTGKDGTFQLTTFSTNDGAVLGPHVVMVVKPKAAPASGPMSAEKPNEDYAKAMAEAAIPADEAPSDSVSILPKKYADPNDTPLKYVVEKSGNNFEITLEE